MGGLGLRVPRGRLNDGSTQGKKEKIKSGKLNRGADVARRHEEGKKAEQDRLRRQEGREREEGRKRERGRQSMGVDCGLAGGGNEW